MKTTEDYLRDWGASFTRQADGKLFVSGDLNANAKGLKQLPDLTQVIVGGNFYCYSNELTSLEGAPAVVRGHFSCHHNRLTSLKGAPEEIGGVFCAHHNPLPHLEGAPKKFKSLESDLGDFRTWEDIPKNLHVSPEAVRRREDALREEKAAAARAELRDSMKIRRPGKPPPRP